MLIVELGRVTHAETGEIITAASWVVGIRRVRLAVASGFAIEKDAMIAREFFQSLPINWDGEIEEIRGQLSDLGYPTIKERTQAACKHLQW